MLSSLANLALGGASQGINSAIGYYFDKKLMDRQYQYQKEVLQNQVQWRYEDLKKAGINPILAGDYQGTATSGVSIPSGKQGNLDLTSKLVAAKQMDLLEQQEKTEHAQTLKTNAEAHEAWERQALIMDQRTALRSQLPQIASSAQVDNLRSQYLLENPWMIKAGALGSTAKEVGEGATSFIPSLRFNNFTSYGGKR